MGRRQHLLPAASIAGFVATVLCDAAAPTTSNLNFDRAGHDGSNGRACVYTLAPAHVVADLQGYSIGGAFEDVPDQCLLGSRLG